MTNGFLDECAEYSGIESVVTNMSDLNGDKTYELLLKINYEYGDEHYYFLGIKGDKVVILKKAEYPGGTGGGDFIHISRDTVTKKPLVVFERFYRCGVFEALSEYEIYTYNGKSLSEIKQMKEEHFNIDEGYEPGKFNELQQKTSLYEVEEIDDNTIDVRYFMIDGKYVSREDYENAYNRYIKSVNASSGFIKGTYQNPMPY